LGCAGALAVTGSMLLKGSPAEALVNAPVMQPEVAAPNTGVVPVAERPAAEEALAQASADDALEITSGRRHWRRRRRRWRRRWRRRHRWVCRRRWRRGRLVRICRRVWW
jgi:hypothetical protein